MAVERSGQDAKAVPWANLAADSGRNRHTRSLLLIFDSGYIIISVKMN